MKVHRIEEVGPIARAATVVHEVKMRPAVAQASARSSLRALHGLRIAVLTSAFLVPLIVVPGLEQPFSRPKLIFLTLVVLGGLALGWHRLTRACSEFPLSFHIALAAWLATLGVAAISGTFASLESLLLPLLGVGWLVLMVAVKPRPKALVWTLAASGGAVAAIVLAQYAGTDPFALAGWISASPASGRMRVFATLGNPDFVSAFLAALLPLTGCLLSVTRKRLAIVLGLFALEAAAILATGSRAAILALAAAALWMALIRFRARATLFALAALCIAVCVLAVSPARGLGTTLRGRLYIWKVAAPHVNEHPLLGLGPGGFTASYPAWEVQYWQGTASENDRRFTAIEDHAHNDYLEIVTDFGGCGLLAFLAVLAVPLRMAWIRARAGGSPLAIGASAGVVALAAVALVDFPLMRPTEVFLLWSFLAVCLIVHRPGIRKPAIAKRNMRLTQ